MGVPVAVVVVDVWHWWSVGVSMVVVVVDVWLDVVLVVALGSVVDDWLDVDDAPTLRR